MAYHTARGRMPLCRHTAEDFSFLVCDEKNSPLGDFWLNWSTSRPARNAADDYSFVHEFKHATLWCIGAIRSSDIFPIHVMQTFCSSLVRRTRSTCKWSCRVEAKEMMGPDAFRGNKIKQFRPSFMNEERRVSLRFSDYQIVWFRTCQPAQIWMAQ